MIETMMSVPSDVLLSASSPRLQAADEFRWNGYPSSECSSQQSQRSAPSESLYTHDLRRALDKSDFSIRSKAYLLKSRSRDHIDGRHDVEMMRVLRPSEHLSSAWGESDAPSSSSSFHPNSHQYRRKYALTSTERHDPESRARTGNDAGEMTSGCHGDEVLEAEEEDVDSPPKITPFSGRILTSIDHPIVKPIPFKPVTISVPSSSNSSSYEVTNRKGPLQNSSLDRVVKATPSHSADDGYASREWQNLSSSSSVSQNSFPGVDSVDRKSGKSSCGSESAVYRKRLSSGAVIDTDRSGCERGFGSSCSRRRGLSYTQTPSPSDSGVGELEAMLREKEMELHTLRDTMERNETAIMQVFEERRQNWETEMSDAVHEWQLKFHGHQQKSFRAEQSLLLQIFKLQQENKNLRQNLERTANEPNGDVEDDLRTKMEELVLEQKRLMMDIDILKSQLKSAVEEMSNKSMELISIQLVLKDNEIEIDCKNSEIHRLYTNLNQLKRELSETNEHKLNLQYRLEKFESVPESRSSSFDSLGLTESLKVDLSIARKELEEQKTTLDRERNQWLEEKTKVVNYQKHLQLNYVQMARKNKVLEIEVQQMTSELDRHDTECERVTREESFC